MIKRITKHDTQNNVLQILNKNKGLVAWEEQGKRFRPVVYKSDSLNNVLLFFFDNQVFRLI